MSSALELYGTVMKENGLEELSTFRIQYASPEKIGEDCLMQLRGRSIFSGEHPLIRVNVKADKLIEKIEKKLDAEFGTPKSNYDPEIFQGIFHTLLHEAAHVMIRIAERQDFGLSRELLEKYKKPAATLSEAEEEFAEHMIDLLVDREFQDEPWAGRMKKNIQGFYQGRKENKHLPDGQTLQP
jgi:hypothetical protein